MFDVNCEGWLKAGFNVTDFLIKFYSKTGELEKWDLILEFRNFIFTYILIERIYGILLQII